MKPALPMLALTGLVLGGAFANLRKPSGPVERPVKGVKNLAGNAGQGTPLKAAPGHELAVFAMGCFWGSETIYRHQAGVTATSVGYSGGKTKNPNYKTVCDGDTGHAEVVLVEYDPKRTSYERLLNVFWENHDSTSGDRQGPDVGTQYRSMVYSIGADQQARALVSRAAFGKKLSRKITTRVEPLAPFYLAEKYHQQYHEKTGTAHCPFPKPPKKRGS